MTTPDSARGRWWSARTGFFVFVWLALVVAGRQRMFHDPGTLWHPVVGERMLTTGEMPRADWLSFTFAGKPWIAQQWLGEIAMALMDRATGLDGLLLAAATVLAATFACIGGRLVRGGLPWPAAAVLVALVFAASSFHFLPRPHLATIAFMAVTVGILADVESARRSPRHLFWLPPLFVLWANVHGGVLGGLATLAAFIGALVFKRLAVWPKRRQSVEPVPWPALLLTAVLCGAAVFVNPYGHRLPSTWMRLMRSDFLPRVIVEHAPLQFDSIEAVMILSLAAVYLIVLTASLRSGIRAAWLLPLLWLVMAILRVRHGPLFAVAAGVVIADMLPHGALTRPLAGPARAASDGPTRRPVESRFLGALIPAGLVAASFALQAGGIDVPIVGRGWVNLSPAYWPIEATVVLNEKAAAFDRPVHVFNPVRFGGYLIRYAPRARVFIDDRCELYGDQFLQDYVDLAADPREVDERLLPWPVDFALVHSRSRLDDALAKNSHWRELHRDPTATLYSHAP